MKETPKDKNPCWKGYKKVGMKDKNGKPVPNCVKEFLNEEISQAQLGDLEKFADRLLAKFNIDVAFTRHFADRANDDRNRPAVKVAELQSLFKKIDKDQAKRLLKHRNREAILKDIQTDLNLPFVLKTKGNELALVMKTIMRKKDFKSPDPAVRYESEVYTDGDLTETVDYKPPMSFRGFVVEETKRIKKKGVEMKDDGKTKVEINPNIE